jgi:hypothetical protein
MAQYFDPRHFADLLSGKRQLKNLRVEEISSVDRGAAIGADVVLLKRRIAERADPSMPVWAPEQFAKKERQMHTNDAHADAEEVVGAMDAHEIGRDVGHMRLKSIHDRAHFSIDRKDAKGRTISPERQYESWKAESPQGRRASASMARALQSTGQERVDEMKRDVATDESHEHQRDHIGGAQGSGTYEEASKRVDKHGLTPSMVNPGITALNAAADRIVDFAKKHGRQLSHARAFVEVCKSDQGKIWLAEDWKARGIT